MSDYDDGIRKILDKLSPEDRKTMEGYHEGARNAGMKAAAAAIMSRNFSHNIGPHLLQVVATLNC